MMTDLSPAVSPHLNGTSQNLSSRRDANTYFWDKLNNKGGGWAWIKRWIRLEKREETRFSFHSILEHPLHARKINNNEKKNSLPCRYFILWEYFLKVKYKTLETRKNIAALKIIFSILEFLCKKLVLHEIKLFYNPLLTFQKQN